MSKFERINRNSLGQFKRGLERLIYTSVWYTSKIIKDKAGIEHTVQVRNVSKPFRITVPQPLQVA